MELTDVFGQLLFLCPHGKELNIIIPFIIGLMVGGFVGVSTMCLFQINSSISENVQRTLRRIMVAVLLTGEGRHGEHGHDREDNEKHRQRTATDMMGVVFHIGIDLQRG